MAGNTLAATAALAALTGIACGPKATVTQATPMASLQSYRTVMVRVAANPNSPTAETQVAGLEYVILDRLRKKCRFSQVLPASQAQGVKADLIMDLNIQRLFRGADPHASGGVRIDIGNQATADVAVVLSDGIDDELLGSAQVRGKSSAVNATSPEAQAITVVADQVAKIMKASGCGLARVARAPSTKPKTTGGGGTGDTGAGTGDPENPDNPDEGGGPTQEQIDQAEALNEEGKTQFRQANASGAAGKFQAAIDLVPDPRYYFNLCLAREAEGNVQEATAACEAVLDKNPDERLREKAQGRLDILAGKG